MRQMNCTSKQALGLEDAQCLIVTGFAKDSLLEGYWRKQRRTTLIDTIKAIAPDAAIAWGYSVYTYTRAENAHLRGDQLYNIKRSHKVYAEMQDAGIPTIPHTYWGDRLHAR
jgi:hypothetical protein